MLGIRARAGLKLMRGHGAARGFRAQLPGGCLAVKIDKSPGKRQVLTGYWTRRLPAELVSAMSDSDGVDIRDSMSAAAAAAADAEVEMGRRAKRKSGAELAEENRRRILSSAEQDATKGWRGAFGEQGA